MSSSIRPTLDRNSLKLLFRNALAQDDVRKSPETLIIKLAAASKISRDATIRVLSHFRKAALVTDEMTLRRERTDDEQDEEDPAITITPRQFLWMARWDMIHLNRINIASRDVGKWRWIVPFFKMPSLRVLDLLPICGLGGWTKGSSIALVDEIVRLNASSIRNLYCVPLWELPEPLPELHLEEFVYTPLWSSELWEEHGLENLAHCVVSLLEVDLRLPAAVATPPVPLDLFANIHTEEICFSMNRFGCHRFSAHKGTTNEHVRRISIELKEVSVDVRDIKAVLRFFPKLTCIKLNVDLNINGERELRYDLRELQEIVEYLASSPAMPALEGRVRLTFTESPSTVHAWTAQNVSDQHDRLMKIRDAIALVPQQLRVAATSKSKFSRVGVAQTEADVRASELGFQKSAGPSVVYKHEAGLGPGRNLSASWTVI